MNFSQNRTIFIKENAFENVVWKMAAILSRPQCVKAKAKWETDLNRMFTQEEFKQFYCSNLEIFNSDY